MSLGEFSIVPILCPELFQVVSVATTSGFGLVMGMGLSWDTVHVQRGCSLTK